MKKILALLLSASLLCGCSQSVLQSSDYDMHLSYNDSYKTSTDMEANVDKVWNETFNDAYANGNKGMGAVALAVKDGEIIFEKAYGYAHYYDANYTAEGSTYANPVYTETENPREMTTDTIFDLASVTKVMATTQSIMILVDRGLVNVNDPVAKYLPGFEVNGKGNITVAQLLTHSSGLPQWEATFLYCKNKAEQLEYLKNLKLVDTFKTDGSEPKYSDFSFMALGFIVEAVSGQDMDVFAKENIYGPLGMTSTTYNPLENGFTKDQIAATSLGNPYEYRMVDEINYPGVGYNCEKDAEAFASFDGWRKHTLIGEVNDGNAGMGGQGIAGHAGLFSTAKDLAILLQTMLNGGEYNGVRLYSQETVDLFTTRHTTYQENHTDKNGNPALSEEFGYGFKLDQSWMGATATEAVYGHDGFTGTTVFVDPENDYIFVCLSNKMQAGFRTATSNSYYNTNSWLSWNMNQAVKDALGI